MAVFRGMVFSLAVVLGLGWGLPGAAKTAAETAAEMAAETRAKTVYKYKSWQVQVVAFDAKTVACVAQTRKNKTIFSIWADGKVPVKLQFYSAGWHFGNVAADVVVRIDRGAKWTLGNAELIKNSVLFTLPSNAAGARFLREVMGGNRLSLEDRRGRLLQSWPLAGSSASVRALIRCTGALGPGPGGKPRGQSAPKPAFPGKGGGGGKT